MQNALRKHYLKISYKYSNCKANVNTLAIPHKQGVCCLVPIKFRI